MFRFSVRDLLWLTLVVALGLAWFARESQLQAKLDGTEAAWEARWQGYGERIAAWRHRTGALEDILTDEGWRIKWEPNDSIVRVEKQQLNHEKGYQRRLDYHEPSVQDDP